MSYCNIHNMNYSSGSGCYYCRDEYKNAQDIKNYARITKLCQCGNKQTVIINKNEETKMTSCSRCDGILIAKRY